MREVVVITGASSGFGRMSALALARAGHTVHASMRDMAGRDREVANEYKRIADEESIGLRPIEMDVADQERERRST